MLVADSLFFISSGTSAATLSVGIVPIVKPVAAGSTPAAASEVAKEIQSAEHYAQYGKENDQPYYERKQEKES